MEMRPQIEMNWRKVGFSFFEIWESLWQASSMPAMLYALAQFLKISVARIPSSKNFEISTINMFVKTLVM